MVTTATTKAPAAAPTIADQLAALKGHPSDIVNALLAMVLAEMPPNLPMPSQTIQKINVAVRQQWGGARITIHKKNPKDQDHRRDQIVYLFSRGASYQYLASKFELSPESIGRIIKGKQ